MYDTAGATLVVKVGDPSIMAALPNAPEKDYFIQKHVVSKREFVSSPSLGFMAYVTRLHFALQIQDSKPPF